MRPFGRMRRSRRLAHRGAGFTLVELIIFIVVAGILAVGVFAAFAAALSGAAQPGAMTQAMELAQERTELILAYKRMAPDYATFLAGPDPCAGGPPPAICTPPAGYAVTTATPLPVSGLACNPDCHEVTVTVTFSGEQRARLTTLVAAY